MYPKVPFMLVGGPWLGECFHVLDVLYSDNLDFLIFDLIFFIL